MVSSILSVIIALICFLLSRFFILSLVLTVQGIISVLCFFAVFRKFLVTNLCSGKIIKPSLDAWLISDAGER